MSMIYLALGTNIGDRAANLQAAREALASQVKILAASRIYETPPWGVVDQPAFLNQALRARTGLAPLELLAYLKQLEVDLGRLPSVRYGPRQIDLDILFYDDQTLDLPGLTIPHPRLAERAFVLVPLADLAPDLVHPVTGKTVQEMLEQVDRQGIVVYAASAKEQSMDPHPLKPLKFNPQPDWGFTAERRPDGGMNITFQGVSHQTLAHWREFALAHLEDSDRLTTNLYDLRSIPDISEEAIRYAVEVNQDPSVRNIRLAVVVANEKVRQAMQEINALSAGYGVEMAIFTGLPEAEAWLSRPLTQVV
jgi:2-amino-4-hydroxy-6-hydroxymethyldihydropteridine diphosphokinase